jgi:hypothetical protein
MLKSLLLVAICGLALSALGQESKAQKQPEQQAPENIKRQPSNKSTSTEKPNPAAEMLQQAYYLGGQLPTDEHAFQLSEVVLIASKIHHPMLSQWVNELMQMTAGLPQSDNRGFAEQTALRALAEAEPADALHMLTELAPAARTSKERGTIPFDPRSMAARTIFPRYWKSTKNPDLDAVRSAANYLGETGQYPLLAVALILKEIGKPETTETLFFDAMRYYNREQNNNIEIHREFRRFLESSYTFVPEAMARSGVELTVDRLLSEAAKPMPDDVVYVGRVYTGDGFLELHSTAENFLFELLPLVRKVEPELERRILEKVPALSVRVPNDLGSLPDDYGEAAILKVNPGEPDARAKAIARATDLNRAAGGQRLARTDPQTALNVANTISDPVLQSETLLAIAQGKLKETDPEKAAQIISDIGNVSTQKSVSPQSNSAQPRDNKTTDERLKLTSLVRLAQAQAGEGNPDLWGTLNRGLDLAEEMFGESIKTEPPKIGYIMRQDWDGPVYMASGFSDANTLVKIGAQKARANTLGWLSNEHDARLKSYLLITAAEVLGSDKR